MLIGYPMVVPTQLIHLQQHDVAFFSFFGWKSQATARNAYSA